MLLPRDGVVYSYVVESSEHKKITDIVSFYSLPSSILKKIGHNHDSVNVISYNHLSLFRLLILTIMFLL